MKDLFTIREIPCTTCDTMSVCKHAKDDFCNVEFCEGCQQYDTCDTYECCDAGHRLFCKEECE